MRERFARFAFKHPALGYLGIIASLVALSLASLVAYAARHDANPAVLWLVALVTLLPVSELVISLVNVILTSDIRPRALPKLALRDGIPEGLRTMVVVPSIIDSTARVDALVDDLEVRFLGNRDQNLHFALLTDFSDAAEETTAGDAAVIEHAAARVAQLNAEHGDNRFFFFHRGRRWNERERRWMGWERKRGKLHEFNRLLRGATDTTFILFPDDRALLTSVRFVITLDSDTQLPMEAARRLVGTLAHPLNAPRFDAASGRVTEGYGVLQPRIGVDLVSANASTFAQVFSGHVGVDPYTTAVSDVYQDLFHEGSYVGKGIYDVERVRGRAAEPRPRERAAQPRPVRRLLRARRPGHRHPSRRRLSVELPDVRGAPAPLGARRLADPALALVHRARRRPAPGVERAAGHRALEDLRQPAPQPAGARAAPPAGLGWTILPGSALLWTVLAVLVLAFPAYVHAVRSLAARVRGVPMRLHVAAEWDSIVTSAYQALFSTTFLAHQAWLMADAIVRTLWRLLFSQRNLLQWVSADRLAGVTHTPGQVVRAMWAGPAIAIADAGRRRCGRAVAPAAGAADGAAVAGLAGHRVHDRPARRCTRGRRSAMPTAPRCARSRGGRGGFSKICSVRRITG